MRLQLILYLIFITCFSTLTLSQDLIILRNGDELEARVSKVNLTDIEYHKFRSNDSIPLLIEKSKVLLIRYESGTISLISDLTTENTDESKLENNVKLTSYYDGSQLSSIIGLKYFGLVGSLTGTTINTIEGEPTFLGTLLFIGGGLVYVIGSISQDFRIANLGYAVGDLYDLERKRNGIFKKKKPLEPDPEHHEDWEFVNTATYDESLEVGPLNLVTGCALIYTNNRGEAFEAVLVFYEESREYYYIEYITEDGKTRSKSIFPKNYDNIKLVE